MLFKPKRSKDQKIIEIDLGTTPLHTRVNSESLQELKLKGNSRLTVIAPNSTNIANLTQTRLGLQRTDSPNTPNEQSRLNRVPSRCGTLGEIHPANQNPDCLLTPYPSTNPLSGLLMQKPSSLRTVATVKQSPELPLTFSTYFSEVGLRDQNTPSMNNFPMSDQFCAKVSARKVQVLEKAGGFEFRLSDYPGRDHDIYFLQSEDEIFLYYGQGRPKKGQSYSAHDLNLYTQVAKEGQGYFWVKNKILFVGYFSNDAPNGPGILIYKDDSYFVGIWTDGKLNGYGIFHSVDSKIYRGCWKDNLQEGEGEEIWLATGTTYSGGFLRGKRHGYGTLFLAEEGAAYKGNFKDNKFSGYGSYTWATGDKYEGNWLEDKMHGKGVFLWTDGRSYSGEYVDGFKDGYGIFAWKDGRKYEGCWKQGQPHGQGTFTDSSGTKSSGVFGEGNLSFKNLSGHQPSVTKKT